jgi:hypothetical protein
MKQTKRTTAKIAATPALFDDAPTTSYLLIVQQFSAGQVSFQQEVELSLAEYEEARKELARTRGLARTAAQ